MMNLKIRKATLEDINKRDKIVNIKTKKLSTICNFIKIVL